MHAPPPVTNSSIKHPVLLPIIPRSLCVAGTKCSGRCPRRPRTRTSPTRLSRSPKQRLVGWRWLTGWLVGCLGGWALCPQFTSVASLACHGSRQAVNGVHHHFIASMTMGGAFVRRRLVGWFAHHSFVLAELSTPRHRRTHAPPSLHDMQPALFAPPTTTYGDQARDLHLMAINTFTDMERECAGGKLVGPGRHERAAALAVAGSV